MGSRTNLRQCELLCVPKLQEILLKKLNLKEVTQETRLPLRW